MAARRRLGRDAVGLAALGIVVGTGLSALGAPLLVALLVAASAACFLPPRGLVLAVALMACFLIAPYRGVGERATVLDPGRSARDVILLPLVAAVPGDAGALAAGLTLGDARYFTPSFRAAMKESATTHLVALSGFNVALLLGALRRLLKKRLKSCEVAIAGCAALLGFLLLAGFQPSLVRASLSGAAALLAATAGRRLAPGRLLLLIAAAMLLIQPAIATHLGFLLSFTASWALLATVGDVEHLLVAGRTGIVRGALSGILPTAVAQAGVAPVLLSSVGSVALVGLLVNPLVVPVTPFLTAVSGLQLVVAHLAPPLASLTGIAVSAATWPALAAIRLASAAPATASFALPAWLAAILYATWVGAAYARKPRLW